PGTSGLQLAWRFSHSITSSALPGHPPFAERVLRNIPPGSRGSLGLEVGGVDHLSPLLGFFCHERPEIARRATENNAAEGGELSLQLGIGEAGIDLLVEFIDDLIGRVLGRTDPIPATSLVVWQELSHGRDVRQRL